MGRTIGICDATEADAMLKRLYAFWSASRPVSRRHALMQTLWSAGFIGFVRKWALAPAPMISFIASRASPRLRAFPRPLRRRVIVATPICTPMATSGTAIGTSWSSAPVPVSDSAIGSQRFAECVDNLDNALSSF